jgi:hypothetical protein
MRESDVVRTEVYFTTRLMKSAAAIVFIQDRVCVYFRFKPLIALLYIVFRIEASMCSGQKSKINYNPNKTKKDLYENMAIQLLIYCIDLIFCQSAAFYF